MQDVIRGFLFDLDNTLIDREAAFVRFVTCFYKERLRNMTLMTREEVVARMVHWDQDGYADRAEMFAKWADEWPKRGSIQSGCRPNRRLTRGGGISDAQVVSGAILRPFRESQLGGTRLLPPLNLSLEE